tara:strand:- start:587 stop:1024 length:438 start_codon:yes stop_codon:yes gene_type:complete
LCHDAKYIYKNFTEGEGPLDLGEYKMAATYDFTPANGGANAVGTLENTGAVSMFLISLDSASDGTDDAPIDLRAVDALHGSVYDMILRELQPLMAHAINDGTGVMSVLMDSVNNTPATILARLANIDGVGSDTTVQAAASFAVTA